jgi:hypothetical protein
VQNFAVDFKKSEMQFTNIFTNFLSSFLSHADLKM